MLVTSLLSKIVHLGGFGKCRPLVGCLSTGLTTIGYLQLYLGSIAATLHFSSFCLITFRQPVKESGRLPKQSGELMIYTKQWKSWKMENKSSEQQRKPTESHSACCRKESNTKILLFPNCEGKVCFQLKKKRKL